MTQPIIAAPGAYADIPDDAYHGTEICPGPSISASGLVLIEERSPAHFFEQSTLNPNRVPPEQKPHFSLGHLLHDILLYGGMVPSDYHIIPDGFARAHVKKWADHIDDYDAALAAGREVLTESQFATARNMAEAAEKHELAKALLTAGEPEMTLAAQDPKTGRWVRARPDILPTTMEIIPDVKSAVDAHPDVFERSATRWGYFQAGAHYLDVIDLIYGEAKRQFALIVIEKQPPYVVTIYALDDGDLHYGRMLNRRALDLFDRCLTTGDWPGYATPERPILPLILPHYERRRLDQRIEAGDLSYEL